MKRKLYILSVDEWDSILEIGDYLLRNKKRRFESFVFVFDIFFEKVR